MFPISLLTGMPAWKLAAAGAVAVLLAGTHWKTYTMGRNGEQAKAAVLKAQQTEQLATFNENQRLIERGFTAKATKAQNDRAIKSGSAQPLLRSVSAELDGLRSDVYRLDTDASGQPASACKTAAITARNVFEQCAQKYTDLAGKADGHDADAVMFESAWPK